ncbi:MAG: hypothetical protein UR47_C0023G0006 [candidate division WS6 bacterium GW2011_GWB1_33_6]|uniref:DUF3324 domain-containing protein n=1 Tax=candidate division WS6 bacterium GW2011_GWB1_33_6 TaxID=1619088 RepID=A0A0G0AS78_9BACT|nr:MAG: hypothetical protein UR47_C0023G0006 [candidate division WS6 bacterium GW2011_GWB1_33_6]
MKFLKILVTLTLIYTVSGITLLYASSIDPAIERVTLSQGGRQYGNVIFTNTEDKDIEVLLTPYTYNPKTDEITEDKRNIFLKVDTDSIRVKAKASFNIKYEIYPLTNLANGTYYNILAMTPIIDTKNVEINQSISQLVILDIVDPNDQVRGVTTTKYSTVIEVVKKGIPFITPTILSYKIKNNSNYLLIPQGRLDVFNEKNSYKPTYIYINEEKEKIYPGETLENEIKINQWYVEDIFIKRYLMGQIFNGVDNNPQDVEFEMNNYLIELGVLLVITVMGILLSKSIKEDLNKKKSTLKKS